MKKYLYVFFAFLSVRMSMHLAHLMMFFIMVEP